MAQPLIGRTLRRLRLERAFSQQSLASSLGVSASYLNLIEHDQRKITATLLIKLAEILRVDIATLSGAQERQIETGLRETFADALLGAEPVPEAEIAALAALPSAARAVLTLYRAWRVSSEDATGITLPSGRRMLLPTEEARDAFHERANHFPELEATAERIGAELAASPAEMNHAVAESLRRRHDVSVRVTAVQDTLRVYDPVTRSLMLSEQMPRESRGFHMAFQLMLLEARDVVEERLTALNPSTAEAASMIRIGLLNYAASCLLMPYAPFLAAARLLRHDVEALAARFCVSFEQVCHRLSTLQRQGERGVPFFFLRLDPAGNVSKRFSAAGFPFARHGGSCPRWIVHSAFSTPGVIRVQVAQLPDGGTFLCIARTVSRMASSWQEPKPIHVIAMGCDILHADDIVYADGLDLQRAAIGIGLSCRLCDRPDCRSRAFPPLEHRLALDPLTRGDSPYRFERKPKR
jgi:predicted transcriptional regulator/DNA-binding XRE family transcriptional regulator